MDHRLSEAIANAGNGPKRGQIAELLRLYYEKIVYDPDRETETAPDFNPSLALPLSERESGILEAMESMLSRGFGLNEPDEDTPLMAAVAYADAPMTEYLLRNGADCAKPDDEEWDDRNWFLADLDVGALGSADYDNEQDYVDALARTALALLRSGQIHEPFHGSRLDAIPGEGVRIHGLDLLC